MSKTEGSRNENLQAVMLVAFRTTLLVLILLIVLALFRLILVLKAYFAKEQILSDKITDKVLDKFRRKNSRQTVTTTSNVVDL